MHSMAAANPIEARKTLSTKVLSFALAFLLAVSFLPVSAFADPSEDGGEVAVIFTNDVHCAVNAAHTDSSSCLGYAGVGALVEQAENQYGEDNVTVVDAGDAVQGGTLGTLTNGEAIVDIMNSVGYDIAVPGNHEFDYGMEQFNNLTEQSEATYISSNFVGANNNPVLDRYKVVEYFGVKDAQGGTLKVAYVGICIPETLSKSSPANFQDENGNYIYGFCQDDTGEALYDNVQDAVNDARDEEGVDYVVAVGHLGNAAVTSRWTSEAVIANTTGIDAFIDGHSHETYNTTVKNEKDEEVLLAQTGTKLVNAGQLTIDPQNSEQPLSFNLVSAESYTDISSTVQSKVDEINANFDAQLKEKVGTASAPLISEDYGNMYYVRWQETNLGDFITDAYRYALDSDIAFINGGGIRSSLSEGDITYEDLINVQPFGNELSKVKVTGQQILDALELGAMNLPDSSGGFLHVSGLTYTVDATIPSPVILDENESFVSVEEGKQRRVSNVMMGDEPLDSNKEYTVASIDYLLFEGGSGMTMFKDSEIIAQGAMIDNRALIEYLDHLGTIGEEYANPAGSGRITTMINKPTATTGLVYTGTEQGGASAGSGTGGGRGYTLSNPSEGVEFDLINHPIPTATDAGTYSIVAAPTEGFVWKDGVESTNDAVSSGIDEVSESESQANSEAASFAATEPITLEWTIAPAPLQAVYSGETITEGQAPSLSVEVTGFVNGETPQTAAEYKAPSIEVPQSLNVGTYQLTPTGGSAKNYEFNYTGGTLTVLQAIGGSGTEGDLSGTGNGSEPSNDSSSSEDGSGLSLTSDSTSTAASVLALLVLIAALSTGVAYRQKSKNTSKLS